MKKILVSLVSDQSAPNITFIKQFKEQANSFLFLSTDDMEGKGMSNSIINSSAIDKDRTKVLIVDPHKFDSVPEAVVSYLNTLGSEEETHFFVNITLGTKMMSLGAYKIFTEISNARIYYIPFGFNGYKEIHPMSQSALFEAKVSVDEYLKSYGVKILSKGQVLSIEDTAKKSFEGFSVIDSNDNLVLENLRAERETKKIEIDSIPNLNELLNKFSYKPIEQGFLLKKEIKYITGGWFEEWTFYRLKSLLNLFDNEIEIGVNTQIIADNDLDVVLMYNNQLHVIECKTDMDDYLAETTLYKSGALNDKFGSNVISHVFTLKSDMRGDNEGLKPKFQKRADQQEIRLADKSILSNEGKLKEYIEKHFKLSKNS